MAHPPGGSGRRRHPGPGAGPYRRRGERPGLTARVAAGPGLWEDEDWLADLRRGEPDRVAAGRRDDRRRGRRRTCAQAGTGTERRGNSPVPGHRGAVPAPRLRRGPRPGLRHARPAGQARHPGAGRPCLLEGPGPVRGSPGPGHVRGRRGRGGIPAAPDGTAFGLEVTQIDGTTLELFGDPLLAEESGVPAPGAKPLLRLAGLLHSGTRRWKAAVTGRYLDGENALADGLQDASGPGQLNLADRGFFSMDRFIRFCCTDHRSRVAHKGTVGCRLIIRISGARVGAPESS